MSDSTIIDNSVPDTKEIITLSDFIEQNQKLITVLGVFTALTVFAGSIPLAPFRNLLSFLFMSLAILVWIELWRKLPKYKYTIRLFWFKNILGISILALIAYWFIGYSEMWQGYLVMIFTLIFCAILGFIDRMCDLHNKLTNPKSFRFKQLKRITWWAIFIIWICSSSYLAMKISPSIGKLLNEWHTQISTLK